MDEKVLDLAQVLYAFEKQFFSEQKLRSFYDSLTSSPFLNACKKIYDRTKDFSPHALLSACT